jgi:diacylglycerol O-acyltransferase / wax synthase
MGRRQVPLSPVDAAWWRLDEPGNVADIGVLFLLERPLAPPEVNALVEQGLGRHSRFRQRVVGGGAAWPRWREDEAFAAGRHVHWHEALEGGRAALERLVGEILSAPLRQDRPPWELHLVTQTDGGGALFARLHHALGDGFGLARILLDVAEAEMSAERPPPPAARGASWLQSAAAATRSLAHVLSLSFDTQTSLRRPLSGERLVAWSSPIPLARLKDIGRPHGATVNDVLLAGIAGSVREHLCAHHELDEDTHLRALCPVNLRSARSIEELAPSDLGNRFGLVFLDLPVDEASPAARLRNIMASMTSLKRSPEAAVTFGLLHALGVLPPPLAHQVEHVLAKKTSVVVTNLPGPRAALSFKGARVEGMLFWVPHPARLALGMSALSYAGEVRLGVRADRAVVAEPSALVSSFERSLEALARA